MNRALKKEDYSPKRFGPVRGAVLLVFDCCCGTMTAAAERIPGNYLRLSAAKRCSVFGRVPSLVTPGPFQWSRGGICILPLTPALASDLA